MVIPTLKTCYFEASEDIILTKFKSQALHIIKIKYLKASGIGNPASSRECISRGAAGARTRRSLGHHLLHPLILRLLVLSAPTVLRPRALQDAPALADPNSQRIPCLHLIKKNCRAEYFYLFRDNHLGKVTEFSEMILVARSAAKIVSENLKKHFQI